MTIYTYISIFACISLFHQPPLDFHLCYLRSRWALSNKVVKTATIHGTFMTSHERVLSKKRCLCSGSLDQFQRRMLTGCGLDQSRLPRGGSLGLVRHGSCDCPRGFKSSEVL